MSISPARRKPARTKRLPTGEATSSRRRTPSNTYSSGWSIKVFAGASLFVLLLIVGFSGAAFAAGSDTLWPSPAEDRDFDDPDLPVNAVPGPGTIGLIVDANFGLAPIRDITEIVLFLPDGSSVTLLIDEGSVFEDLVAGGITDLRFFCSVPESALASGEKPFELRWGEEIESPNRSVERLVFDPIERERYRRLVPAAADSGGGDNIATIMVIAESGADWYFLWYLLPLGVLLALVTVWKILAGRGNPQQNP